MTRVKTVGFISVPQTEISYLFLVCRTEKYEVLMSDKNNLKKIN